MNKRIENIYALTPMQEAILFHTLNGGASAYFSQATYTIREKLQVNLFQQAIDLLSERHEALRTAFVYEGVSTPVQVVLRDRKIGFSFVDFSSYSSVVERDAAVATRLLEDEIRAFDIIRDPLLRITLIRLEDDYYRLIWSYNHLILDGQSHQVILTELSTLYQSLVTKTPVKLEPPTAFKEYVKWLEKWDGEKAKIFWKEALQDCTQPTRLPSTQEARTEERQINSLRWEATNDQYLKLRAFAAQKGITLNVIFQVLWGMVLAKETRSSDVIFGHVVAGRPNDLASVDRMVGLFINTIPKRFRFLENETIDETLTRAMDQSLVSLDHQHLPLRFIKIGNQPASDFIHHLLVFHRDDLGQLGDAAFLFNPADLEVVEETNYDLLLEVFAGEALSWQLAFDEQQYEEAYVQHLLRSLSEIMEQVLHNSTQQFSQFVDVDFSPTKAVSLELHNDIALQKFWKERIQTVKSLELPYQFKPIESEVVPYQNFTFHPPQEALVRQIAIELGTTPEACLLALLQVWLTRYGDQKKITILLADQEYFKVEQALHIGVLQQDLSMDMRFEDLVHKVHDIYMASQAFWGDFDQVWPIILEQSNEGKTVEAQVAFNWPFNSNEPVLPATWTRQQLPAIFLHAPLDQQKTNWTLRLREDVFGVEATKVLVNHFFELLESATRKPSRNCHQLEMCTEQEMAQILGLFTVEEENWFNQAAVNLQPKQVLNLGFEQVVKKYNNAIAIAHNTESWTYDRLNKRANQIGHSLRAIGVEAATMIGVYLDRCPDLAATMLGILKAGAVYVPLDTQNPPQRIREMIKSGEIRYCITTTEFLHELVDLEMKGILLVDDLKEDNVGDIQHSKVILANDFIQQQATHNLPNTNQLDSIAYMLYTSGSTGTPKGALLRHDGALNHILAERELLQLKDGWRFLQSAGIGSDISIWQFMGPLLMGGEVVIIDRFDLLEYDYLIQLLQEKQIQLLELVPSFSWGWIQYMNQLEETPDFSSLQYLLLSGEAASVSMVNAWLELFPDIPVVNAYGPCEASDDITQFIIAEPLDKRRVRVPIGKPIPNLNIVIVDEQGELCPIGVMGEICVSGIGVGAGYHNLPTQTQAAFVPNRFLSLLGETLYKTGDRGRWLPDGNIDFLGRIDHQVKLNGHRVELGEVEAILRENAAIEEAHIMIVVDVNGRQHLATFIVSEECKFSDNPQHLANRLQFEQKLRRVFEQALPAYMCPSYYVFLDKLPRNLSDKIDERKLNEAFLAQAQALTTDTLIEEQLSEEETQLLAIWKEVLGTEQVSVHDNFFEKGGDSIMTIQLAGRAKRFGLAFKPKDVFAYPTIAELIQHIVPQEEIIASVETLEGACPLSPIQQWFFAEEYAPKTHYCQAIFLEIDKEISIEQLNRALDGLIHHHDSLRLSYEYVAGEWIQKYDQASWNCKSIDCTDYNSATLPTGLLTRGDQVLQDLHIEGKQLLGAWLFETPIFEQRNRLLIGLHHLVVDGVSWRIMLEDLELLLLPLKGREPQQRIQLSPKGVAYRSWVEQLETWVQQEDILEELPYWKEQLMKNLPIPTDKAATTAHWGEVTSHTRRLNKSYTQRLLTEVHGAYSTTMNDILLSALAMTLADWTQQNKVAFMLEGHGRQHPTLDLSSTVGWFTSLFPLGFSLESRDDISKVIKQIKEYLSGIPNDGIGFGLLKYLHPSESVRTQLQGQMPEVIFNFLGQLDAITTNTGSISLAKENVQQPIGGQAPFSSKMEINGFIKNGHLHLDWNAAGTQFYKKTIKALSKSFFENLKKIIDHCTQVESLQTTVSDLRLTEVLSQAALDQFLDSEAQNGQLKREVLEDIYPLSPIQEGILFHELYEPDTHIYLEQLSFTINGTLDIEAFQAAWQCVLDRHQILRTAIHYQELTVPLQAVHRHLVMPFSLHDLTHLQDSDQEEAVNSMLEKDYQQGFDFAQAPLMRIQLLRLAPLCHKVVWTRHHILLDGWSDPILIQEVLDHYLALIAGNTPVSTSARPFREYLDFLARRDVEAERSFWANYLEGIYTGTSLPWVDVAQDRNRAQGAKRHICHLDPAISERLQTFARREKITMSTLVQGLWAMLLSRYTAATEVVFGVTVAGRPAALLDAEDRIGIFINTIPCRVAIDAAMPVGSWLRQLQQSYALAREFESTPLSDILAHSQCTGDLFDTIVVFENYPIGEVLDSQGQLQIDQVEEKAQTNYPLSLIVTKDQGLSFKFLYDDRLSDDQVAQLSTSFVSLMESTLTTRTPQLQDLAVLGEHQKEQLLSTFNGDPKAYPTEQTVIDLFREQVSQTPNRLALRLGENTFTYTQLDHFSDQLAMQLLDRGLQSGDLVGLCVDRSIAMVVAILGIMKAGGAYVPIDPEYPEQRIQFILDDTGVSLLIIDDETTPKLPAEWQETGINVQEWNWEKDRTDKRTTLPELNPAQLAYVIYTSGSTGRPKGVMVAHNNLVNLSLAQIEAFELEEGSRVLQFASISFDASCSEIFTTLLSGACLIIPTTEDILSISSVGQLIEQYEIDTLTLPPSYQAHILDHLASVKTLISAGEPLNATYAKQLQAKGVRVLNAYGPTENTVCISISEEPILPDGTITIGKPIANVQVYIMDDQLRLCPVGVVGELLVGGAQVARGYLNREDLNAEKFIEYEVDGQTLRLYRTGDLAKWVPNGDIVYIGRRDEQVKLRGRRVELGEINALIEASSWVQQSVVVLQEEKPELQYLVAYLIPAASYDQATLQAYLMEQLPNYMLPSRFVVLEEFPLTTSGKVNKAALPRIDFREQEVDELVLPRNEVEEVIANAWASLLDIDKVSVYDNFFERGGHSLLATRLAAYLRRDLAVEVSVRDLFENSTIAAQASLVEASSQDVVAASIKPATRPTDIPLSFAQERLWFLDQLEGSIHYHLPAVLQLNGPIDLELLELTIKFIVNRHESLRTVFREKDGVPYQHILDRDQWALGILKPEGGPSHDLIDQLIKQPFDLAVDHGLRAWIVSQDTEQHMLVLILHHIVADAWSVSALVKELIEIYGALAAGRTPMPVELPVQYADYALWQREYMEEELWAEKVKYWKNKLQGVEAIDLVADFQRPAEQSTNGKLTTFSIDQELTNQLKKLAQQEEASLFMLLLTLFKVVLHKYSGQSDLCIGTTIANRQEAELEHLIGFFINTLAIRTQFDEDISFLELLRKVKENALEAYQHQEVPFEKVVEQTVKGRDLSRHPLFQIMFELQNTPPIPELELAGTPLTVVPYDQEAVKFDLSFNMVEQQGSLIGEVEYCTDLFTEQSVQKLIDHFKQAMQVALMDSGTAVQNIDLVAESERLQLLGHTLFEGETRLNNVAIDLQNSRPINVCFEEAAAATPGAMALIHREQVWSFAVLNKMANQMAHTLVDLGVRKGDLVGVYLDRSVEMVASLLAILKAGAVYVPLDTQNPPARIELMAREGSIRTIVGEAETLLSLEKWPFTGVLLTSELLPAFTDRCKTTGVDCKTMLDVSQQSLENPANQNDLSSWAYVLYTSGSTGKPKGAITRHNGAMNHLLAEYAAMELEDGFRFLQSAAIGSDISVWQILGPILKGGTTVLVDKMDLLDYSKVTSVLQEYKVNVVEFVPSYLWGLIDHLENLDTPLALPHLKWLMMVGEEVPVALVNKWKQYYPALRIVNAFGPCEAADDICQFEIRESLPTQLARVPIGRPIANMNIFVLDEKQGLSPIGVPGEIAVSGVGVGAGYLGLPEKTAAAFINNPFADTLGETLYLTGDRGRWNSAGQLEFLGRMDRQLKLRGHRIELGEIEAFLLRNKEVLQAHLVVTGAQKDSLVAFVVTNVQTPSAGTNPLQVVQGEKAEILQSQLLAYCREGLPTYMQPSHVLCLNYLPINISDKVDDKALLALLQEGDWMAQHTTEIESFDAIEHVLLGIWQDLLIREHISKNDDFFELGGHSLLAIRLRSAIVTALGKSLSVRDLFVYKTIATQANYISGLPGTDNLPLVEKTDRPAELPLSFAQERLWFLDKMEGSRHYHLPVVLQLSGYLNQEALEQALRQVMDRHEILRTVYKDDQGIPYQVIKDAGAWTMRSEKIDSINNQEQILESLEDFWQAPFNLAIDFPIRACLLQHNHEERYLAIVLHHIASDGWSNDILITEVMQAYQAQLRKETLQLPSLPIQYADYAIWQRNYYSGSQLEDSLRYWQQQLKDTAPFSLPIDYERPKKRSINGTSLNFAFSAQHTTHIKLFAQANGVTPFMLLLSAFKVALFRYSYQEDICVGTAVANRDQQSIASAIGFFVNVLALRTHLSASMTFTEVLTKVKRTVLEAFTHQGVPFEKVVDRVSTTRDLSRSPIFQVLFSLQNEENASTLALAGLDITPLETKDETTQYELLVNVTQEAEAFVFDLSFCTDLFEQETIERFFAHYEALLLSMMEAPQLAIEDYRLLSRQEEEHLRLTFNNTENTTITSQTVLELFNAQVRRSPDQVAICFEEEQLTYAMLDKRATALAHLLVNEYAVEKGDWIGILMERSHWSIISILGILKAGAAYVPIDPAYPEERKQFILEDANLKVLLTHSSLLFDLMELPLTILPIDIQLEASTDTSLETQFTPPQTGPEDVVYVIYTSGSTGVPKGVVIQHKGLSNYLQYGWQTYGQGLDHLSFPLFTSLSFDLTQTSIFLSLISGGQLVVEPRDHVAITLPELLQDDRINAIKLTPAHVHFAQEEKETSVEVAILGGEQLTLPQVNKLWATKADMAIFNEYGPTETTIGCTVLAVDPGLDKMTIGTPIDNMQILILDPSQKLCPVGVMGEICIGGIGLAKQYHQRPELTQERFIAHPYEAEQRLYRTGDVGRWLPNGQLEFFGRRDDQVKLNAYRIELGEIERNLEACSWVTQAAVIVKTLGSGEKQLIGFYTSSKTDQQASTKNFLKAKLPAYMLPGLLIEVDEIPLTQHGKVDRRQLAAFDTTAIVGEDQVAARDQIEEAICELWQELLEVPSVGIKDDFFELGGHSLLATRAVAGLKSSLNVEVDIQDIFNYTVVEELATFLKTIEKGRRLPPIKAVERPEEIPLSFAQERLWFIDSLQGSVNYHIPALIRLRGPVNIPALEKALLSLIERHEVLRTVFEEVDGRARQRILTAADWTLEVAFFEGTETDFHNLISDCIHQPFDLKQDKLIRAHLIQKQEQESFLLLVLHHIAADGWSLPILVRELTTAYGAWIEGHPPNLPALPIQYADYAIWQRNYLNEDTLDKQLSYWKEQLHEVQVLDLPTDFVRPHIQSTQGDAVEYKLDEEIGAQLKALAKAEGITLFMLLLGAFKVLLYKYTSQRDICVGTPVAGRTESETEEMVGFFVNMLALRSQIDPQVSFSDVLQQIKAVTLAAFDHQLVPFEQIVDAVTSGRDLSRTPIFQLTFGFNASVDIGEHISLPGGLDVVGEDLEEKTSTFDLNFDIDESSTGLSFNIQYCTDLFSRDTIHQMLVHFEQVLVRIIENPKQCVEDINLVSADERAQLLGQSPLSNGVYLNEPTVDLTNDCPINVRFESVVSTNTEAIAIVDGALSWSYGQLNARSNQLAHTLLSMGVEAGDFVGIYLDRKPDLIAAILAILKCGGVYVPLDTQNPPDRIEGMMEDSSLRVLISDAAQLGPLSQLTVPAVLLLDTASVALQVRLSSQSIDCWSLADISTQPSTNPANRNEVDSWAYMLYTSGSTGKPKGAITRHDGALNHILAEYAALELKDEFRFLQSAGIGSDISVWQILAPLLKGGAVVLINKMELLDYDRLLTYLEDYSISIIEFVPSYLWGLVDHLWEMENRPALSSLDWIMMVGEEVPVPLVNRWLQMYPSVRVLNGYGPCEASDDITQYEVKEPLPVHSSRVPIGRPLSNMHIVLLDDRGQLCPIGIAGEICVSGVGVGAGYWGLPEKTAERFIPNPFEETLGEVLYKTGDLGRWRVDGNLEFLGRKDRQVKLRGHRVELGEIESFIRQQVGVKAAHVMLRAKENGGTDNLAFVVMDEKAEAGKRFLGKAFEEQLQSNMDRIVADQPALSDQSLALEGGLAAFFLNKSEALFAHDEIFREHSYLKNGIELDKGAVVFDVGANIGMFSIYVGLHYPEAKIFAFEPLPPTFEILKANANLYALDDSTIIPYNYGLANRRQRVTFTHYPENSMLSGRFGDIEADKSYVRNVLERQLGTADQESDIAVLVEKSMREELYDCELLTLSEVIQRHKIERIDLLKVDVERSEIQVLEGIKEEDWPKIQQIVIEVHDDGVSLNWVKEILEKQGFSFTIEQEELLVGTDLYNVYATRTDRYESQAPTLETWSQLRQKLLERSTTVLPDFMRPTDFCLLKEIPINLSDKVDEKALLQYYDALGLEAIEAVPQEQPSTPTEQILVNIWEDLLARAGIGVHENFFEIGGHSLLAMRLKSMVKHELGLEVSIIDLFTHTTIKELGRFLDHTAKSTGLPPIEKQRRPELVPLSYAQERIWFIDRLEGSTHYHIPAVLRLTGKLKYDLLEQSFRQLVERHEILRTVYWEIDGQTYQVPLAPDNWCLSSNYLHQNKEADQCKAEIEAVINRPFDLEKDYMLRAHLIYLTDNESLLVLVVHHIASDGWSESIMVNDLIEIYSAKCKETTAALPELPLQYADYAIWQRQHFTADFLEERLSFWERQLDQMEPLRLPTDFPRPSIQTAAGAQYQLALDTSLRDQLTVLARDCGTTFFTLMLTAFKVLLYRYSNQTDICVGTAVANRSEQSLEGMIGFFVNAIALRSDLSGNPGFTTLLEQVKQTSLSAYAHQDVPFEKIVERVEKDRDMSRSPIFQVVFASQNIFSAPELSLDGLSITEESFNYNTSKFDLTVNVFDGEDLVYLEVDYSTDLFKEETIAQLMQHFKSLLSEIARDPQNKVGEYVLLSEEEKRMLLLEWNDTAQPIELDTLVQRFERQCDRLPHRTAVEFGTSRLSYEELDQRANQLAHQLRKQGVLPESIVGICVDRSLEMIIGLLGILKAGGACAPMDPAFPQDRIDYVLHDINAKAMVTSTKYRSRFSVLPDDQVCLLDTTTMASVPVSRPEHLLSPNNLAYIIYTSGSTGRPKGVQMEHASIINELSHYSRFFDYSEADRQALLLNYIFDGSVEQIFLPLTNGACLVVLPKEVILNADLLAQEIETKHITHLQATPSLVQTIRPRAYTHLRRVCAGGELCPASLAAAWAPYVSFYNKYGPTEATINSSCYKFDPVDGFTGGLPLGRPLSNVRLYVLNDQLQAVPPGAIGEIFIGGKGVTRAYLNKPALTAERFIPSPFVSGERLYRSGDLGRWLVNGMIEFKGRTDDQVKVRGYRIELGEIQSAIEAQTSVEQAVVLAVDDQTGSKALVAYLIPNDTFNQEEIRTQLSQSLPEYMVPSRLIALNAFPLTFNGKVDKRALPDPWEGASSRQDVVAPRNATEQCLYDIWRQFLSVEEFGIHDNFFELGGHSLIVTRVAALIQKELELNVPIMVLFQFATIAELSTYISTVLMEAELTADSEVFDL